MFGIDTIIDGADKILGRFKASPEERAQAQQALRELERQARKDALEYESNLIKEQSANIRAEAKAGGIAAAWRPITMLTFTGLIALHWFGVTPENLPQQEVMALMDIVKLALGGYVIGRSAEKVVGEYQRKAAK